MSQPNESRAAVSVAVVDIGSSAIRMLLAEIKSSGDVQILEKLQKPIQFGHDVFANGKISRQAMNESLHILSNFKKVIDSYGVSRVQAIATSAVRDADNSSVFLDRVFVRTGIDVEILEGPEENRLELIAVENALAGTFNLNKHNCLIVEVGSGSTELIILNKGSVEINRTLSFGSMRLPDEADIDTDADSMQRILKRSIKRVTSYTAKEYNLADLDTFIALGSDMRFVAQQIEEEAAGKFITVSRKDFTKLVKEIAKLSPDRIHKKYGIPYDQAESLYPSLLYYFHLLDETGVEEVIVPMTSIRDGILTELTQIVSKKRRTDVTKQILSSSKHLAAKFKYDKPHAAYVEQICCKLFDFLGDEHGMGGRERMLLEVAAILHDIGSYISPSNRHKHSRYLVEASDIFGLRKTEKQIVANVVRYHRKSVPKQTHIAYMSLPKADRAVVAKLSAILRVADALDQGRQQKITEFELEKNENACTLWVEPSVGDISLEKRSLASRGDLFADLFGVPITIRKRSHRN